MTFQLASSSLEIFPRSLAQGQGVEFGLVQTAHGQRLAILAMPGTDIVDIFEGENSEFEAGRLLLCPLNQHNAAGLRRCLPWLNPKPLGMHTSFGTGDRLGIATPGHVRAMRSAQGGIAPIYAQQSIREMQRTGRNPQQVLDEAMWGMFEEGWQAGVGADADHLKTKEDIDICFAAGYTFFTLDPGQYVDNLVDAADRELLTKKVDQLPGYLQPECSGLLGKTFEVEGNHISFDPHTLRKAAVKYGKALHHIVSLFEHLRSISNGQPIEVEISMDETDLPTTPAEHVYLACEMQRLGVRWVSFAPRFIGKFEKGVDYIGDLREFDKQMAVHAGIARQFGPYKLSLHSGSDKFSIYPAFMHHTRGVAHVKTAGTSYLEALRTIASLDKGLFSEIYRFALQHFEVDKKSYHISAQTSHAPSPDKIPEGGALLDQFDARQILHVTFGSVLTEKMSTGEFLFYDRIMELLEQNRELYFRNIEEHFRRHLEPFLAGI